MNRKQKVILFFLTLLLFFKVFGQERNSKSIIKSEEITYVGLDGGILGYYRSGKIGLDEYTEYNPDGTESKIYALFNKENNKNIHKLNEIHNYKNGKLSKVEKIGYETGVKYEEETYVYDEKLNLTKKYNNRFEDNKLVLNHSSCYSEYFYNNNEKTEKIYNYDDEKKVFVLASIVRSLYDNKKNIIKEITENFNGNISGIVDFIYNKEYKLIEMKSSYLKETRKFKYNKKGDLEEERITYENRVTKEIIKYTYRYDNKENWIEQKAIITRDPADEFEGGYLIKEKSNIINQKLPLTGVWRYRG